MNITAFFRALIDFCAGLMNSLNAIRFTMFGFTINLLDTIIMFLVISALINVLWRGAKT